MPGGPLYVYRITHINHNDYRLGAPEGGLWIISLHLTLQRRKLKPERLRRVLMAPEPHASVLSVTRK